MSEAMEWYHTRREGLLNFVGLLGIGHLKSVQILTASHLELGNASLLVSLDGDG